MSRRGPGARGRDRQHAGLGVRPGPPAARRGRGRRGRETVGRGRAVESRRGRRIEASPRPSPRTRRPEAVAADDRGVVETVAEDRVGRSGSGVGDDRDDRRQRRRGRGHRGASRPKIDAIVDDGRRRRGRSRRAAAEVDRLAEAAAEADDAPQPSAEADVVETVVPRTPRRAAAEQIDEPRGRRRGPRRRGGHRGRVDRDGRGDVAEDEATEEARGRRDRGIVETVAEDEAAEEAAADDRRAVVETVAADEAADETPPTDRDDRRTHHGGDTEG